MRTWVLSLVLASSVASADDTTIRMRRHGEAATEPWLHLDAIMPNPADAEGGLMDGRAVRLDLGPRARFSAEGKWWQSGLAPSMFAEDLHSHGYRAAAELSYDLGPFHVGVNASMGRVGDSTQRMVGLFAFRTFRLSRWMHAWITFGVAFEQTGSRQGTTIGLTFGTTFR
ncbi:MAG TPA: hypothetical protein VIV11_22990 [Kofleriaceae bacterium]